MFVSGDTLEISYAHPTLGNGQFQPKANESFTIDLGGVRNADDTNGITSGGELIQQKNRQRWSLEGAIAVDFTATGDTQERLNALANDPTPATYTVSFIGGGTYKGTGILVGDLQTDTNAGTKTIKIVGGGKMIKIA